ncbi:adenine phosphoribosyltransferase [Actinotalea ferrariae CF5-4]|uniref:Adenine phosphoribosyltransferase n=1 Tax=Actinotalea ferrariae CF5-4 TaxID=948458 RepID=A0A021VTE9_9CELL|nr:adenine phosphoribosyltransferase [Actinotalea ferrariae]EYR64479.1 adenine phosphoribosyltransferase [Actinotalea ferrariae CF5-4]
MTEDQLAARVRELIHDVPDYPEPGVVFKDITPLLADGPVFRAVVDRMAAAAPGPVDLVVGMEARGFILGAPVAAALGAGFIPARKAGKLPRETVTGAYDLEYGSAVLEVHADTIGHGARVLVVDDVLATGGTAAATVELIGRTGGEVVGLSFLMELTFLHGREKLAGQRLDVVVGF